MVFLGGDLVCPLSRTFSRRERTPHFFPFYFFLYPSVSAPRFPLDWLASDSALDPLPFPVVLW